ncbi:MAG TPA: efflux RND transporter periplasmic adaptor subunit [Fibrobacteria bacterium]|nr:efflux RND transporter periplasmic adaptor subunit [Fibrobacteria bacterium]
MNIRVNSGRNGEIVRRIGGFVPVLALVAAAALLAGCGKKGEKGKEEAGTSDSGSAAVRVVVVPASAKPFEDWGNYSADLRGSDDATLAAPSQGGRVANVSDVGKAVQAGQALCDIESQRYQAMMLSARSAMEVAKGEMDRQKMNVEKGFVGKAVLDQAELQFQQARVAMLQSQRSYEDSRCQAPFSGVLVSRMVERFQTVAPGAPTVRIAATARLQAVVAIPESEARDFREGQTAEFSLVQDSAHAFVGKLKSIDRAVEARNRTVMARIDIPNSGNVLRPGMVGKTRILRKKYDKAIVVPSNAVLRLQDGTMVMVVKDGKALQVPVRLGPAQGDFVVVEGGLSEGDLIITVGAFRVSTGTKVTY